MPVNYPGDPTATQSPSVAPCEDDVPTLALPIDTDPPNGATFEQAYKAAADWIAFLRKPFAKANAWAQSIQKWQNARNQDRFLIDHLGYPGGDFQIWTERWRSAESLAVPGSVDFTETDLIWTALVVNPTGGQIVISDPDASGPFYTRYLAMTLGTGSTDATIMFGKRLGYFAPSRVLAMEWDVRPGLSGIDEMHLSMGLGSSLGLFFRGPTTGFQGMAFYKGNADVNWMLSAGDGTNVATPVDSGVAVVADVHYKLRLEFLSSGVADDNTDAVHGYVNGTHIGTITAVIPGAGLSAFAQPFFSMTRDTGSTVRSLTIGQTRVITNT